MWGSELTAVPKEDKTSVLPSLQIIETKEPSLLGSSSSPRRSGLLPERRGEVLMPDWKNGGG